MTKNTKSMCGALALAPAALALAVLGCGTGEEPRTSVSTDAGQEVVVASAPTAGPVRAVAGESVQRAESPAAFPNDSLPPDVAASVVSTEVTPGTVIEVTAEGSPDVEEVLLADGRGTPQRFVYDPAADLWRASYRVPIRFPGERLGLAVTAKNQFLRWRRVWVFLTVMPDSVRAQVPGGEE